MVCEREFEMAIAFVRLQLSFAQCRLTIAPLDCDEDLPSTAGSSGRLQLGDFARSRICFIEFCPRPKNAGEIVLRRIGSGSSSTACRACASASSSLPK